MFYSQKEQNYNLLYGNEDNRTLEDKEYEEIKHSCKLIMDTWIPKSK